MCSSYKLNLIRTYCYHSISKFKMFNHKKIVHGKPDISVPAHLNFGKYIFNQIKLKSDEVALENSDTNDKLTYKELTHYAINLAVVLRKLGAGVGDTVAVGWEKRIELTGNLLGVIFTGATVTCYDVDLGLTILKHQLHITQPKYFITSNLFWNTHKDVLESYECIQSIIRIDDNEESGLSVKSLYATIDNVDQFEPAEVKGQTDVAMIFYSSGTTGNPKGVALTHLNCICSSDGGGIYQNPFLRDAYVIVALCMQSLSLIGLKLTKLQSKKKTIPNGISQAKKDNILKSLHNIIPNNRLSFWMELPTSE